MSALRDRTCGEPVSTAEVTIALEGQRVRTVIFGESDMMYRIVLYRFCPFVFAHSTVTRVCACTAIITPITVKGSAPLLACGFSFF